jgi:hypothetical protein
MVISVLSFAMTFTQGSALVENAAEYQSWGKGSCGSITLHENSI